jgi:putative pyruvate formate lyase activating enzyme
MKQQVLYYLKYNQASVAARTLSKAKNVRNYVAVPIQRIERVSYSGPVYNLEVEDESHTYTANCLAVGNCQNSDISHDKDNGVVFTPQRLAWSMWQLRMEGCHNINLVGGEPTIHLHTIVQAIDMLKFFREFDAEAWSAKADAYIPYRLDPRNASYRGEFNTPILWNSNMYMSLETLRILRELVDIWLPDFKFGNNKCAIRLSRTPWYFETVAENHRLIYGWGEDIVIRHLIMPGHVECCTKPVLKWIAENMPEVPVNVMDQYHPDAYCNPADPRFDKRYVDMARYPTREEILEAYRYAERLGLNFGEITFERSLRGFRP